MGQRFYCIVCASLLILLSVADIVAVDIGSDTIVTRFNTQQTLNDTDRVAGFAELAAGFALSGPAVTATFDSFFPVVGTVKLAQGRLVLNRDLVFHDVTTIKELGNLVGNFHAMDFSSSVTAFPMISGGVIGSGGGGSGGGGGGAAGDFYLKLVDSEPQVDDVLTGAWSYDGKFVAIGLNATAAAHDVISVYTFDGTALTLKDTEPTDAYVAIQSLRFHPSAYLLAVGREVVAGNEVLVYSVDPTTGVLTLVSGVTAPDNVYAVDWHPTGSWIALGTAATPAADEIRVHAVSPTGVINPALAASYNVSAPAQSVKPDCLVWSGNGNYLALAMTVAGSNPEFRILAFNQATPALTLNAQITIGRAGGGISWNPTYTQYLAVGSVGTTVDMFEIYEHDATAGTITLRAGVSGLAQTVRSVSWNNTGDVVAIGRYAAAGNELQLFGFSPTSPYLTSQVTGFAYTSNLEVVRWSPNGKYLAVGGDDNLFDMYAYYSTAETVINSLNISLLFNQNVYWLQQGVHFSGQSIIDGGGHTITLCPTCSIIVDSNSSLMFKDVTIKNLDLDKIQMVDSTGTITLNNVNYVLDGNYTMTHGKMFIVNDFTVSGEGYSFAYQTDQALTISKNARMLLDNDITFSYVPRVSSRSLINLSDSSSELWLRGATLYTTTTGLRLATGRLVVDRGASLYNQGTVESEAISFANNLDIQINPAAQLDCLGGLVVYE